MKNKTQDKENELMERQLRKKERGRESKREREETEGRKHGICSTESERAKRRLLGWLGSRFLWPSPRIMSQTSTFHPLPF